MSSIATLATFFGWCTVINIGVILLLLLVFAGFHEDIGRLSAMMFGIAREEAKATLFRTFMQYRMAVGVFSLVPYIALKIMA